MRLAPTHRFNPFTRHFRRGGRLRPGTLGALCTLVVGICCLAPSQACAQNAAPNTTPDTAQSSAQNTTQEAQPQFADLAARAAAARDAQNLPLAIDLYRKADQLNPNWAEGWWYLGQLSYDANQYAGAIDAFNHVLQLNPKVAPAFALRGLCEYETGAYDDALRDLNVAAAHGAASDSQNAQILRFHLAQLLTHAQRFQEALLQYQYFAAHNLENPDMLVAMGLAGLRVPSFVQDVPAPSRALYQSAGEAGFTFLADHSNKADSLFQALFARYPALPGLHFFYGLLLFSHAPDLAAVEFQKELDVSQDNVQARAMLALSLMVAGEYHRALPEAELAYKAAPDMEMAQLALGRSLAETGDIPRATTLLQQVLKQDPNSLEAHLGMASVYSHTGKREEADRERKLCRGLEK
ncbi:MAG: tetratricopeptide repeat protein [Terracidiphilus sp.]